MRIAIISVVGESDKIWKTLSDLFYLRPKTECNYKAEPLVNVQNHPNTSLYTWRIISDEEADTHFGYTYNEWIDNVRWYTIQLKGAGIPYGLLMYDPDNQQWHGEPNTGSGVLPKL